VLPTAAALLSVDGAVDALGASLLWLALWPVPDDRRRAEIAVEMQLPVLSRNMHFIVVGIKDLYAVLRAFRERRAMPGVFV